MRTFESGDTVENFLAYHSVYTANASTDPDKNIFRTRHNKYDDTLRNQ